jgi:hypothetical protein
MLLREGTMLCCNKNRSREDLEMHHDISCRNVLSEADFVAEARMLQARHARGTLGAVVRRLRGASARSAREPAAVDGRRLTVH